MGTDTQPDWHLPRFWWAAILLPCATFFITNLLLTRWGGAGLQLAHPWMANGNAEAAGRLKTEATFLLYCGLACCAIAYAIIIGSRLTRPSRFAILLGATVSLSFGVGVAFHFHLNEGDAYLERAFPCVAFELLRAPEIPNEEEKVSARAQADANTIGRHSMDDQPPNEKREASARAQAGANTIGRHSMDGQPPNEKREASARAQAGANTIGRRRMDDTDFKCRQPANDGWLGQAFDVPHSWQGQDSLWELRIMYALSALLLFLGIPAVLLGAIACLALPETNSAREQYAAWAEQTKKLNRLLYITAGFMISGLLFTNARLMWPAFSLHPDDLKPFTAHVSSVVLYAGVSNSLLIASYYVPVAAFLARARPRRPLPVVGMRRDAEAQRDDREADPWAAFRKAIAIMSPAIVALVGEMVKFAG
jgi:hypothetical protein